MVVFVDKRHVAATLNLINVANLKKVLRFEVFVSEDRQLRAVHVILNFEPISDKFQDVGHAIRVYNPRLALKDVLVPGFLARDYIVLVELPSYCASRETSALQEETASSLLEAEIDQFHLEEEREERGDSIIKVSD